MSAAVILTGYTYSVYTRAVRMALTVKGVTYAYQERDPFDAGNRDALVALHPFGRVPVLEQGCFRLWETQAILDYVDMAFDGPPLTPKPPQARARMRQVMGIADSYVYWPLVRQAVSQAVFAPLSGEAADTAELRAGLQAAPRALDALDEIAGEGLVLGVDLTLADCLLWPMLDYFRMVPEGAAMLSDRAALSAWAARLETHAAAVGTKPDLTRLSRGQTA